MNGSDIRRAVAATWRSCRRALPSLALVLTGLAAGVPLNAASPSITITPSSGTVVDQGSSIGFTATLNDTPNDPLTRCYVSFPTTPPSPPCNWTWTVSGGGYVPGNPGDPNGTSSAFLSQFTPGTFTITVSRYNVPPASIGVTVRPMTIAVSGPASLPQGESGRFTATFAGVQPDGVGDTAVTWSLSGGGTLSPDPTCSTCSAQTTTVYAGTTAGSYLLTATSVKEPAVAKSYAFTVLPPPVASITPTSALMSANQQVLFSASAINTSDQTMILYTDDPAGFVNMTTNSAGYFGHDPTKPGGVFHVMATSERGGTPASAPVTVVVLGIVPTPITVLPGTSRQFFGQLTGSQQSLAWSTTVPGATIGSGGRLQVPAGTAAGAYTVKVQTVGNPLASATAAVAVASSIPVTGVAISPARSVIDSAQQEHLDALVLGQAGEPNPNQAVTWSVAGPAAAAVDASGLFTAPAVPGVYTVTATSQADGSKSATATVTVGEDLMVLPSWASVAPGTAIAFTAEVTAGGSPAVTWSVEEGSAGGSISAAGLYTAPAAAGVYHVLAVSTAGGEAVQGMATVVVGASPEIAVTVAPAAVTLAAGGMQRFTAAVQGSADTAVAWTASDGAIEPSGLFTAPPYYGTVTITATSHADGRVQGAATVVVSDAASGQSFQYDADGNLLADGSRTYEWDAENHLTAINIGTHRSEFVYDGLGRRVLITEKDSGAVTSSRRYLWIGDQMVEETDALSASSVVPPGSGGSFEAADCGQLAGWAWDATQPAIPQSVDVYDGATRIATVLANAYRADLKAAGVGGGAHGFTLPTPAALKTGAAHTVQVLLTATGASLGSRSVTCAAPTFGGSLDIADCTQLAGWAWDANQPNAAQNVDVYDGATKVATVYANIFRQDLLNAHIGNGVHGFALPAPPALKTGGAHTVSLKVGGTAIAIGTAKSVTCTAANLGGSLDQAACNTVLGWAWDANQPNTAINVDLFDAGVLLATVPANVFRQDLVNAGIGNGIHGFAYTPPFAVSSSHTVTARPSGSSLALNGSPKSVACASETVLTQFVPYGMVVNGNKYYYSFDQLGSVREVTDRNGTVVSRYDYDPFGRLTINQGAPPRIAYAGYLYHAASGLELTEFRAYDPDLGRWASRDPLELGGGLNPYSYVDGDPVDAVDPFGLKKKCRDPFVPLAHPKHPLMGPNVPLCAGQPLGRCPQKEPQGPPKPPTPNPTPSPAPPAPPWAPSNWPTPYDFDPLCPKPKEPWDDPCFGQDACETPFPMCLNCIRNIEHPELDGEDPHIPGREEEKLPRLPVLRPAFVPGG